MDEIVDNFRASCFCLPCNKRNYSCDKLAMLLAGGILMFENLTIPLRENEDFISFEIYLSSKPRFGPNDLAARILGDYLANLAYEGVLCKGVEPFKGFDLAKAVVGPGAYPMQVYLVRSSSFLKQFQNACAQLEALSGPALNGHAPTAFAASRIAQKSENSLSRMFTNGGLNFLELNNMIELKDGRGGELKDHPRQHEADMEQDKKRAKGVTLSPIESALSDAEKSILKAELADLKRDISNGVVPSLSGEEALKLFEAGSR